MSVWINAARHDVLTARIDDRRALGDIESLTDGSDCPILAQYVGTERPVRINDGSALN
jgi:hypothetical protein